MVRSATLALALLAAGPALTRPEGRVQFVDTAAEAGLVLRNSSGGGAEKWTILESTGAGACFLDHDGDGDLDLYLVNGATLGRDNPASDALFENDGRGHFTDVTVRAGLGDDRWGGGCAVGDYDNDGDPDLYVTNFGPDVLYRNQGGGIFRDVTGAAGLGDPRWGLGAVFVDFDRDGDLDLYVANYLRFDPTDPKVLAARCRWKGGEVMCGPRGFEGEADVLYRNDGDGTFTDVSSAAGVGRDALYGMGAVAGDLEGDGDPDLFVANDSQENLLWVNDGTGRFADQALPAGVALSGDGRAQAGMGADLGDYDGDGDEDLFVTNFSDDYHTLYRNEGDLLFTDVSAAAGLDPVTRPSLGWGGGFFDFDNDGDLDLFVASGHVYPGVERFDPATSYRQRNLLLENDGRGRFAEVSKISGPGFAVPATGRGAAFGDWDDDGDLDVVVVNADEAPTLLRNDGGNARPWIKLRLIGRRSNRDGIGARLRLTAGGRTQFREVRQTGGYCSSHDPRVHFGLGAAPAVERLEVRWPSGREQVVSDLPAGHLVTLDEEQGVISAVPLARRSGPGSQPAPPQAAAVTESAIRPAALPAPAALSRLTPEDLRRIDVLVQEGTRRILAGQYGEGIAAYERALARLPAWEQAAASPDALGFGERERYRSFLAALHDNLGVGLMRAERLDECAAAIGKALEIQPGRAKFHANLGLCHYHAHRSAEAVAAFEAAARASDPPSGLRYDLGRALAAGGRCGEAEAALAAAIAELPRPDLRGRDAEAWYHLGSCLADRERLPEAADAWREALARVPGHQKALYKLTLALRRSGRQLAAERAQALFAARQPADEAVRSLKRAGARGREERLRLIRAYLDAGLAAQAVQEAQTALAADPRDARAAAFLGQALLALHPPALDLAEQAFRRALKLDPRQPEAVSGLGETLRHAGRLAEAEDEFQRALSTWPDDVAAAVGLARTVATKGEVEPAVARLEGLRARGPKESRVLRALAEIYVTAPEGPFRRPDEALALLDQAGELYGEALDTRLQALALLSKKDEVESLLAESPFLGQAERAALARLAAGE